MLSPVLAGAIFCAIVTAEETPVSFQKEVAPIFVERCLGCHNSETTEGEYSMATVDLLLKGGEKGAAVEPGKPETSLLSRMLAGKAEPQMPFEEDPLPAEMIAKIDGWIRQGAKFDGPNRETPLEEMVPRPDADAYDPNYQTTIPITALAFSPDGKTLAASGYREITLWEPTTGKLLARWPTKAHRIADLEFTKDGKTLIHAGGTPGRYGEVVVWDVATAKEARTLFQGKDMVFCLAIRPGDQEVATGGTDRIFRVFNIASGQELHAVENHADWILGIAYTTDGKHLLTASRDRSAKVWDQTTAEPILTFAKHTDAVYAIASNPDASIAASIGADRQLRLWKNDGTGDEVAAIDAHGDVACAVVFPASGQFIVTAGADHRVRAWNPADKKLLREYAGHQDFVYSLALSADETLLAAGAWNGKIIVWNASTGNVVADFVALPSLQSASAAKDP